MKALYNFVEADTGYDISNYNQMDLHHPPSQGDLIGISADDQPGETIYHVEGFTHHFHRNLSADETQVVDIHLRKIDAKH